MESARAVLDYIVVVVLGNTTSPPIIVGDGYYDAWQRKPTFDCMQFMDNAMLGKESMVDREHFEW